MEYVWGAGAVIAVVFAALLLRRHLRSGPTPEELERRRRALIHARGKLGDGEIIDVTGTVIIYVYQVAGVGYEASQDVSALRSMVPADLISMVGPVSVKFDPRNPANSIVISEDWSGFRA